MSNSNKATPEAIEAWKKAAAKQSPDGDLSRLDWHTPEGLTVKPLYTAADTAKAAAPGAESTDPVTDIINLFGSFGVDKPHLIVQIVNFTILAFVLYRFAIKPALGQLEERIRQAEQLQKDRAAAEAFGQRNAVELRARSQPDLHALGAGMPHQREAAALARQQVADLAVEHAGAVDHQALHAVEDQGLGGLGNVGAQLLEFLVHGAAACHEGSFLLGREGRDLGPALEAARLHVQRRQEGRTLGVLPVPEVAILHVAHQIGQSFLLASKYHMMVCWGVFWSAGLLVLVCWAGLFFWSAVAVGLLLLLVCCLRLAANSLLPCSHLLRLLLRKFL